ncbi:MAG TPA: hypothetical protein EYH34_09635 [Planctomycetes bacterium]|nr:hypothetical protein [Planctomycetota bacterium]
MSATLPHYVLISRTAEHEGCGQWRFVLQSVDGGDRLVAFDAEPGLRGERLELFAIVRGLEALRQPSRVTLVTPSAYLREGLRYGLSEWRKNGWRWEWFGQMVPVKNADLWQRVDRALQFHQVECRTLRMDAAHRSVRPKGRVWARRPAAQGSGRGLTSPLAIGPRSWVQYIRWCRQMAAFGLRLVGWLYPGGGRRSWLHRTPAPAMGRLGI